MSNATQTLFLQTIHPSWIKYLHNLHWSGILDAFLSKGYASFKLTDEERKKWSITPGIEHKIQEILQSVIDESNAQQKKYELLSLLASVESVSVPNFINDKLIIDEIHKEDDQSTKSLLEIPNFCIFKLKLIGVFCSDTSLKISLLNSRCVKDLN